MLAQYICTTNIEQSIDFYTNVVGLRYVPRQADQQESLRSREGGVARSCDVLLIRDETISMASSREAGRIRRTRLRRVPGTLAQDLYFLSRYPLDYVRARIQAAGRSPVEGPVIRKGSMHMLRMLYLLDPDGNRIRLVELSA